MTNSSDPYIRLRPEAPPNISEICNCKPQEPMVLQVHLSRNPLSCALCNLEIPPERVGFDQALAETLAAWRDFYNSFYYLWLDSGEFEEWAAAQLRDVSSPVNIRGLKLTQQLAAWRPCYLWWFQDEAAPDWTPDTHCPKCSRALELRFSGMRPNGGSLRICETCLIAIAI